MKFLRNGSIELLILGVLLMLDIVRGYHTVVHVTQLLVAYATWILVLLVLIIFLEEPFILSQSVGESQAHPEKVTKGIALYCIVLIPVFLIELISLTVLDQTVLGAWNTRGIPMYQLDPISSFKAVPPGDGKYPGKIAYFDSENKKLRALSFNSDSNVWVKVEDGRFKGIEIPYYTYFVSKGLGTQEADSFWQQVPQLRYVRVLNCPFLDSIPISRQEFFGGPEGEVQMVLDPHIIYVK